MAQGPTEFSDRADGPEIDIAVLGESSAELAAAIAKVTSCDPLLNQSAIADLARDLLKAGYSAQNILDWHQKFWLTGWRSKGGPPSIKEVRQFISQATSDDDE